MAERSIPAAALSAADRYAAKPAIVDGAVTVSFEAVRDGMLDVAASLISSGIQPGDRVALWAPNCAAWVTSALGILAAGGWLVPVNTRFKAHEAAHILSTVDASQLFVAEGFLGADHLAGLRADAPTLRALADPVLVPGPGERSRPEWAAFLARGTQQARDEALGRIERLGPDDVSDVIFTSGTTGMPKGVMLRHGPTLRAYEAFNNSFQVGEGDRVLIALPFFHCFGYKAGWLVDLRAGATTYPLAVYDPTRVMEMIEANRITHMPGSPTMFWPILDHPARAGADLSSLRSIIMGAAFVPVELVRRIKDEMGVATVLNGYGLTENHAIVSVSQPADSPDVVAHTVGKVLDGLEVKVVDDDGRDLGRNAAGELLVRGFTTMTGYYGDPEATASVFVDGWLRTGDVAVVDERDYLRITDRKKDIYINGGFNVAPTEVENVLLGLPGISQVAVVGIPHPTFGEVGAAFVVAAPGHHVAPADVVGFAKERLANFKVPAVVEVVEGLPVNATGKVLKDELRGRLAGAPQ